MHILYHTCDALLLRPINRSIDQSTLRSLNQASDILEASMEAGLTLREVEDIVFSNTRTLEFFNSADFKQVRRPCRGFSFS